MTISTTATSVQYLRNGTTTQWGWPNKIFSAADLTVIDLDTSVPPIATLLILGTDYTVSNVDVDTGCLIVTTLPGVAGHTLDVRSNTSQVQSTSIKNQGSFLPELHEEFFDRITRETQDLTRKAYTYGIHGPDIESTPWSALPTAALRANTQLIFNAQGMPGVGILATSAVTQGTITGLLSGAAYTATVDAAAPIVLTQNYNYAGGSAGFVVPVLNLVANVTNCGNNFAWTLLAVMNNSSTGSSENVAFFAQGTSVVAGASPTFAATFEGRDLSGAVNPTKGRVSVEIDRRDNGTDANLSRVALDIVCTRPLVGGAFTGAVATIGYAVRVGSFGDTGTTIGAAYTVFACNVGFGLDVSSATVIGGAVRMANNTAILFDISGAGGATINRLAGNAGSGLDHSVNGVLANRLLQSGGLQVGTVQVVGPRNAGWSPWTGTLNNASVYDASTVTLVQLAQRTAAMQNALTAHGLLGA